MILKRPRDFACLNQFVRLRKVLGDSSAVIVVDGLWTQLGYQLEIHGASGFFEFKDAELFLRSLPIPQDQKPVVMSALLESGFLRVQGHDFDCPLFLYYNPELDKNYIPDANKWYIYDRARNQMEEDKSATVTKLPKDCWFVEETRVMPGDMNRIVMLVKTVDGILKLGRRAPEEYDTPLIHAALRVIQSHTDARLDIILKRLWIKRSTNGIPRNTVAVLNQFEDVLVAIMPNDGFLNWARLQDPHGQTSSQ